MRGPSVKQICYWVLALALFAVRSVDAHVHLCLDGQEQRTSLHVADAGVHHADSDVQESHNDKDVKFVGDGVFKKGESTDLWLVSSVWSLVNVIALYISEPPRDASVSRLLSIRSYLRPPLRGPPR